MDKEDKQIINRAIKENWRIGDRTRLKRLLEKNLKLYRENVELERKLEQAEKDLADYQFNYPKIKELEKENAELKSEKGCETCTKFDEVKLTKAKELLNEFMRISKASDEDFEHDYSELVREAEQFIKEIEK